MATDAYWRWVGAGKPWRVARPIKEMVALAGVRGVDVLGTIGNDDHLTADFPEDHTPFSFTAEPIALPGAGGSPGYWVCACDLADEKGWGAAILRDARAGRVPWLKYMNWAGKHYAWSDGFAGNEDSSDRHIHLSCFSGDLDTPIGNYDPEAVPMSQPLSLDTQVTTYKNGRKKIQDIVLDEYDKIFNELPAMARELTGVKEVVDAIREVIAALPQPKVDVTALVEALRPELSALIRSEIQRIRLVSEVPDA